MSDRFGDDSERRAEKIPAADFSSEVFNRESRVIRRNDSTGKEPDALSNRRDFSSAQSWFENTRAAYDLPAEALLSGGISQIIKSGWQKLQS